MNHLGDITKINGADITPVNVVIGGSPCQDLSVAGKRAGLAGERSGLFMEQLRVIKEMRRSDENNGRTGTAIRPRFMVWENVPGAFSSNKGADFGAVLQETVRVVCKEAPTVPKPKNGWPTAGCLVDVEGHWSVAWRVFDAQFWGVPQRRRRIALVADFGGPTAPEILFERESVSGNSTQSGSARKRTTAPFEKCSETAGEWDKIEILNDQGGDSLSVERGNVSPTLRSQAHGNLPIIAYATSHAFCMGSAQANAGILAELSTTLTAAHEQPIVFYPPISGTLCASGAGLSRPAGQANELDYYVVQAYAIGSYHSNSMKSSNPYSGIYENNTARTLDLNGGNPCCNQGGIVTTQASGDREHWELIARRLTPLECERLQGFPDGWTDIGEWVDTKGKVHKESTDSARYKALGNSIAIPPWTYVLQRLSAYCGTDRTMASLFDGIGGFPLIWERINGKGACLWASEIEEFPIAVTKYHF